MLFSAIIIIIIVVVIIVVVVVVVVIIIVVVVVVVWKRTVTSLHCKSDVSTTGGTKETRPRLPFSCKLNANKRDVERLDAPISVDCSTLVKGRRQRREGWSGMKLRRVGES